MSKIVPVLCISKTALSVQQLAPHADGHSVASTEFNIGNSDDFSFISRNICDHKNDLDTVANSFLQLLPYCIIYRCNNGSIEVLTYDRGNGAEARLHTNSSIGFGGHIYYEDMQGQSFDLNEIILNGLCRELSEEVGIISPYTYAHVEPIGTILDYTNAVGKRHLCLGYTLKVSIDVDITDCHEITNPRWESLDHLQERCNFEPTDTFNVPSGLESWSEKIIPLFKNHLNIA